MANVTFLMVVFLFVVMFSGSPDLHDKLVDLADCNCPVEECK